MGIKVKAVERNIAYAMKDNNGKEVFAFIMQPVMYGQLGINKVIKEVAKNTGLPEVIAETVIKGYKSVVGTWATEGHSVPIPGLGTMRFGLRAKSVSSVDDVKASLITSRRVIFTPSVELKKLLEETSISITCYDRNGNLVKSVTSGDSNDVEDPDNSEKDNNKDNAGTDDKGSESKGDQGGTSSGDDGDGELA